MTGYTFGDTNLAAQRLAILDATFAPPADSLLSELDVQPARIADLGCGPGATTTRLAARFPHASITGLDASPAFVSTARARVVTARFTVADVTAPLPKPPYDLIYARFLLAHLPDVGAALRIWSDALAPGGLLVLEETGSIASSDPDFSRYEALASARVATTGACVYAGPLISAHLPTEGLDVVINRVLTLDLTAGQAAAMFWRNLATWGPDAVAHGTLTDTERADLLARLQAREDDPTRGLFTWTHHQLVARRA